MTPREWYWSPEERRRAADAFDRYAMTHPVPLATWRYCWDCDRSFDTTDPDQRLCPACRAHYAKREASDDHR